MIVLQESALPQTINIIPRQFFFGNSYNIKIVNETTNTEVYNQDTTEITELLYYNQFTAVFPLKQDVTYNLTVTGSEVVYKDKIFCTNESDVTTYKVNENAYIFNDTDNEFITL